MFSSQIKDQRGFTLVEMIAILLILGIMFTVAAFKYYGSGMAETAAYGKVLLMLNSDEKLCWSSAKLDGTHDDTLILGCVKDRPGVTFKSSDGKNYTIEYSGVELKLARTISNHLGPGRWHRY